MTSSLFLCHCRDFSFCRRDLRQSRFLRFEHSKDVFVTVPAKYMCTSISAKIFEMLTNSLLLFMSCPKPGDRGGDLRSERLSVLQCLWQVLVQRFRQQQRHEPGKDAEAAEDDERKRLPPHALRACADKQKTRLRIYN